MGDFYKQNFNSAQHEPESRSRFDFSGEETRHPVVWFFIIAVMLLVIPLAVMLFYYFGPAVSSFFNPHERQTTSITRTALSVGKVVMLIPENFLRFKHLRSGGEKKRISLYVKWPEMAGYSEKAKEAFTSRTASSPIIYVDLTAPERIWSPRTRLEKIYPTYFIGKPEQTVYGLTRQAMKQGSGYDHQDLFFADTHDGLFLAHCDKTGASVAPADCYRDMVMDGKVEVQYRFRRTLLGNWKEIDRDINQLLYTFWLNKPSNNG
ncbi:MAG: hypothetical protein C0605_14915 [Hyphomicrobiales bacterium]|nr:MAG: hypothetical protein C0605_14915 [Hyphomicrobiales bacterium]